MNYAQDRLDRREIFLSVLNQNAAYLNNNEQNLLQSQTRKIDHTIYGQIGMMLGWNINALYHYGRAWYEQPTNCYKLGDYVQMIEIYGYPEIALLTIFVYRTMTRLPDYTSNDTDDDDDDDDAIRRMLTPPPTFNDDNFESSSIEDDDLNGMNRYNLNAERMIGHHCGCCDRLCGRMINPTTSIIPCWIPISYSSMEHIIHQFQIYIQQNVLLQYQYQYSSSTIDQSTTCKQYRQRQAIVTAHEILGDQNESLYQKMIEYIQTSEQQIPLVLQFWDSTTTNNNNNNETTTNVIYYYRPIVPIVQMLCMKLLYLILPSFAIEAMIHIRFKRQFSNRKDSLSTSTAAVAAIVPIVTTNANSDGSNTMDSTHHDDTQHSDTDWDNLSQQYKSHNAYYVFIQSLILGERIKLTRRRQMEYHHIALWDRLWGIQDKVTNNLSDITTNAITHVNPSTYEGFIKNLQNVITLLYVHEKSSTHNDTAHVVRPQSSLPHPCWLQPITDSIMMTTRSTKYPLQPIFLIGDSHILSLAWQIIHLPSASASASASSASSTSTSKSIMDVTDDIKEDYQHKRPRLIVPILITGLKAWHIRSETKFFTNTCLRIMIQRLPRSAQTIIISAGEIDCREGMGGPLLQGYKNTQECYDHIKATVAAYITSLEQLIKLPTNSISQILITPVAPHVERNKGRVVGQVSRRVTTQIWNDELRRQLIPHYGTMFLLDYTKRVAVPIKKSIVNKIYSISPIDNLYSLNPIFNADSTHMNNAVTPIFEDAILQCGCDFSKL